MFTLALSAYVNSATKKGVSIMPRNPQVTYGFSMQDQSAETGRVQVYTAVPEDLVGGLSTAMSDFMLAVNDVTLGTVTKEQSGEVNKLSNVRIGAGNREDKMLVSYQDNVTLALYDFELPTRDNTLAVVAGTDYYNLAIAPWANFKTKTEAALVSPDGNAITVVSVKLVGRNI